jgi:hypothetical protein
VACGDITWAFVKKHNQTNESFKDTIFLKCIAPEIFGREYLNPGPEPKKVQIPFSKVLSTKIPDLNFFFAKQSSLERVMFRTQSQDFQAAKYKICPFYCEIDSPEPKYKIIALYLFFDLNASCKHS